MFIFRKLEKKDYIKYFKLINTFRKSCFTKKDFEDQLELIGVNSEIWIMENEYFDIIGTGTILYEYKFIHDCGKIGHLEDICIHEEYRGKGYGEQLIKFLVDRVEEKKGYKVILDCNPDLENFYSKAGLEKRGIQMAKYY